MTIYIFHFKDRKICHSMKMVQKSSCKYLYIHVIGVQVLLKLVHAFHLECVYVSAISGTMYLDSRNKTAPCDDKINENLQTTQ